MSFCPDVSVKLAIRPLLFASLSAASFPPAYCGLIAN
jgi:hypothetical protein